MKKVTYLITSVLLCLLIFVLSSCASLLEPNKIQPEEDYSGQNPVTYIEYEGTTDSLQPDFSALYDKVKKSVVRIKMFDSKGEAFYGSGFIVNEEGFLVTSSFFAKPLFERGFSCEVFLADGTELSAVPVGYDTSKGFTRPERGGTLVNSDIALLKLASENTSSYDFSPVSFAPSSDLSYGEDCFTISSVDEMYNILSNNIITKPYNTHASAFYYENTNLFGNTLAEFFDGSIDYLIQTGIQTNAGCEGAPLFNGTGQVIGMLNLRAEQTAWFVSSDACGISFATPSAEICDFLSEGNISYLGEVKGDRAFQSIIRNASDLDKENNNVARSLMNEDNSGIGSNDYFVVDEDSQEPVLFSGQEEKVGETALSVAANNLDKTVKLVVYYTESAGATDEIPVISEGSGFIVDKQGYVLTNLHVINKLSAINEKETGLANSSVDISDISVYAIFERGLRQDNGINKFVLLPMEVYSYHQQGDLALLKFKNEIFHEEEYGMRLVEGTRANAGFADSCIFRQEIPNRGEKVFAIGNALGYGISISCGIISLAEFPSYSSIYGYNMLQTDCPINSGNSGGPLFDRFGCVVGVNTLGLSGELVSTYGYENVGWVIPSSFVVGYFEKLNEGKQDRYITNFFDGRLDLYYQIA